MSLRDYLPGVAGIVVFTLLFYWSLRAYSRFEELHPEAVGGLELLRVASLIVYLAGVSGLAYYILHVKRKNSLTSKNN